MNFLSGELQQPIQDETGMDGVYEIAFHFRPADANGSDATSNNIADASGHLCLLRFRSNWASD